MSDSTNMLRNRTSLKFATCTGIALAVAALIACTSPTEPEHSPVPTSTAIPTVQTPTSEPAATPAPTPNPTVTLTYPQYVIDAPALEYGPAFNAPRDWRWEGHNRLVGPDRADDITVISVRQPPLEDLTEYEDRLSQFAGRVRDNLARDWWDNVALLEVDRFERVELQGYIYYKLEYRVQESPEYCALAVKELITLAVALPGPTLGVKARTQGCETRQSRQTDQILDSFRVVVREPLYYTQYIDTNGIVIKANPDVEPEAMHRAAETVDAMLQGRADLAQEVGAAVAIVPEKEYITTIPEFAQFTGKVQDDGRAYDGFIIRGLGAVKGQPVTATSEENLLRRPQVHDPLSFVDVTIHEFAHAIENLCFTSTDRQRLTTLYDATIASGAIDDTYAATNEDEFFAVFTTAYFNATTELATVAADREQLETDFPEVHQFLSELYGDASEDEFQR